LIEAIVIVLFSGHVQNGVAIEKNLVQGALMSHAKHIRFLGLLLSFALLVPFAAYGQSSNGAINGNVVDDSGSALPGVTVTATNVGTAVTRTAVSNGTGHYEVPLLIPGTYRVSGELSGFQAVKFDKVVVNVGTTVTLDFRMKPGVAETVTVTAAAPVIETTKSEVSSVVNDKSIQNLPVNGRNFIDFALTTPGVVKDPRTGDISFAGQRGTLNSLVVDGADNNNTFFGQSLGRTGSGRAPYQFSQDAVKEFQVNANGYSSEYGRAGGAVINVITKSGTNDFDGSLFEFYRDKKYRAQDYLNVVREQSLGTPVAKSPYHFNQYGGSLGGPIVRDKHFFFANYDAQRNSIPNDTFLGGTIPSDAASQATAAFLAPKAVPYSQNQNQDVYLLKTDSELTNANHLSLRFNRQNFTGVNFENGGPQSAPEHTGNSLVKTNTLSLVNSSIFSNSLFNEVRAQYAKDQEPGLANSDQPEATIRQGGTTALVIGRNSFSPRETTINRHQIADTLTFITGAHTIKGGFDYNKDNILNFFPGNFSGVYVFNNLADFPNKPASYLQNFPGPGTDGGTTHPDLTDLAFFVGDEWRVRPTLTINAGLRYDRQNFAQPKITNPDPQLLAAGLDTGRIHEDGNNYGPRLGFAWTPGNDGRTVVRGGYGIFYGRTPAIMIGTGHSQNGIQVLSINFPAAQFPTWPNRYDTLPAALASLPQNIFVFAPNFQDPKVQQSSLGFERGLTNDLSFGVTYQYVKGSVLPRTADINVANPVTSTINIYPDATSTTPIGTATYTKYTGKAFTNFNRVLEFQSNGHSKYNGITFDLQKRFAQNWQARLAYTYSKAKDDHPDATIVVPGVDDAREAQDALNLGDEYTWADTDVRHRVVLSGVWNIAYADGIQNSVAHALLSGWSVSAIVSYQSGQPYTPVVNGDLNGDNNRSNDRAPGYARNSLRLPSQTSIDPRLTREIRILGGARLQLIAEAFNLTNRSNVTRVRNTLYNLSGSGSSARLNTVAATLPSGYQSPSAVAGPRTYQFAAKFLF
jgi:outer membrane receptor protein involved in Fe transport